MEYFQKWWILWILLISVRYSNGEATLTWTKVKQLIHPYSPHILQNVFPGDDPSLAEQLDQYNHSRNPAVVALKHHFWFWVVLWWTVNFNRWLMNYVWDELYLNRNGSILWMEEDHLVTNVCVTFSFRCCWPTLQDFYRTVQEIEAIRQKHCPEKCFGITMHGNRKLDPNQ